MQYFRKNIYRNIKIENKISMTIPEIGKNKINVIETIISQNLVGIGFNEIINNSRNYDNIRKNGYKKAIDHYHNPKN